VPVNKVPPSDQQMFWKILNFPPIFSAIFEFRKIVADLFQSTVQALEMTRNVATIGRIMREKLTIPWTNCQNLKERDPKNKMAANFQFFIF